MTWDDVGVGGTIEGMFYVFLPVCLGCGVSGDPIPGLVRRGLQALAATRELGKHFLFCCKEVSHGFWAQASYIRNCVQGSHLPKVLLVINQQWYRLCMYT